MKATRITRFDRRQHGVRDQGGGSVRLGAAVDVKAPVAKARAAASISDWACPLATAACAAADAESVSTASVRVPTPCA